MKQSIKWQYDNLRYLKTNKFNIKCNINMDPKNKELQTISGQVN